MQEGQGKASGNIRSVSAGEIKRREESAAKISGGSRSFLSRPFSVSLGPLARRSFKARLGRRCSRCPKGGTFNADETRDLFMTLFTDAREFASRRCVLR